MSDLVTFPQGANTTLTTFPGQIGANSYPAPGSSVALGPNGQFPSAAFPYQTYTPTLTGTVSNPNLGSTGTIVGSFVRIGQFVHGHVLATFAGSGVAVGSGNYVVSLPVGINSSVAVNSAVGAYFATHGGVYQSGTGAFGSGGVVMGIQGGGFVGSGTVAWAAGDTISVMFAYRSA